MFTGDSAIAQLRPFNNPGLAHPIQVIVYVQLQQIALGRTGDGPVAPALTEPQLAQIETVYKRIDH